MVKNIILIKKLFPDWKVHIYMPFDQDEKYVNEINKYENVVITLATNNEYFNSTWRFMSICEDWVDIMVCRDADSRISIRDKIAIDEWLSSDYNYHIIRDHPIGHHWPMNAGMWGAKKTNFIKHIDEMLEICENKNPNMKKFSTFDQEFLKYEIYPIIVKESLIHDEYYKYEPHASPIKHDRKLNDFAFIGESLDENEIPRGDQRSPIRDIYSQLHPTLKT